MASIRGGKLVGEPSGEARFVFLALLFLVPLVFWPDTWRLFAPAKRAVLVGLTGILVVADRAYLARRLRSLLSTPADLALTLVVLYLTLSALWTSQPGEALLCALPLAAWWLLALLAPHQFIYERGIDVSLLVLGLGFAVNAVLGALQVADVWIPSSLSGGEGPFGWVGNRNWFGCYLALLLPVELYLLRRRGSRFRTVLAALNVVLGLPLLVLTWCRGAWGGLVVTLVTWGLMILWGGDVARLKRRLGLAGLVAAVLALLVVLLPLMAPMQMVAVWGTLKQQTLEQRVFAYGLTLGGIGQAPLVGHGLGSFGGGFTKLQEDFFAGFPARRPAAWTLARPFRHAHDELLELLYEGGAVGLILALAAVFYAVRRFFVLAQRVPAGPERERAHVFFAMGVGFVAMGLTGFPFRQTTSAVILAVILALLQRDSSGGRSDPEPTSVVGTGAALMVGLLLVSLGLCDLMSEAARGRGLSLLATGDLDGAEREFRAAVGFNPVNGRALAALGRVRLSQRRFDEAEALFDEGARHHMDHTWAFNRGIAASMRGEAAGAVAWFTRSARQLPCAETLTGLGRALGKAGDGEGAEAAYRLALESDRGAFEAAYELHRLLLGEGRTVEAVTLLADNVRVIDARLAAGLGGATAGTYLVRNLRALSALGAAAERPDLGAEAGRRLEELEKGGR